MTELFTKKRLILALASFGILINPSTIVAYQQSQPDQAEMKRLVLQEFEQRQTKYIIQYDHLLSNQSITQVFDSSITYDKRVKEIEQSQSHSISLRSIVRDDDIDIFITKCLIL